MDRTRRLSGRHIAIMSVAACAAIVCAPVGVMAASHSSVSIADGKHPSRLAHVTTSGEQVVNVEGSTTVNGSVTTVAGKPSSPYLLSLTSMTGHGTIAVPTGTHFIVQTVSVRLFVPADVTTAGVDFSFTENGHAAMISVPLTRASPFSTVEDPALFMATVPAAIYPDPGTTVSVQDQYDAAVAPQLSVTLSGYRA
jgi:hypothetical protein